jgi:hypothetical protein
LLKLGRGIGEAGDEVIIQGYERGINAQFLSRFLIRFNTFRTPKAI